MAQATTTPQEPHHDAPPPPPNHDERSPSPPPNPPTALTPGARAARLISVHATALQKTLDAIPYSSFAACFPTIATTSEPTLRNIHTQIIETLSRSVRKEFERTLEQRNVVEGLNKLEDLIADAERRRARALGDGVVGVQETPPHLLDAEKVVRAHVNPVLVGQRGQLNARIQTQQGQNARLMEEVRRQRGEIEGLLALVEGVVGDLREAGALLGEGDGRAEDAMGAERVLGGL